MDSVQRLIDGLDVRERGSGAFPMDVIEIKQRHGRRGLIARIIDESNALMVADLPDFIVRTCSTEYLLSLLERDMQKVSGVWLKGVLLG